MDSALPRKRKADLNDESTLHVDSTPRQLTAPDPLSLLQLSPKRQRLSRRPMRRGKVLPRPPPINRLGNDIEDIGIVNPKPDPGPASGSLLRNTVRNLHSVVPVFSAIPYDPNSPHIPSSYPLVNRHTLKELHLDAILRNPQLRHDILFDPAITFRPTQSKQKKYTSDLYWSAISTELETGCTCVSFDTYGRKHPTVCVCKLVPLPNKDAKSVFVYPKDPPRVLTLRMPSRIQTLLEEFIQVFLLVVQPQTNLDSYTSSPRSLTPPPSPLGVACSHAFFDPQLIHQELLHNIFEPAGVFKAIGDVLKAHCAPMRDCMVSNMVATAQEQSKDRKTRTVQAIRMCMDILELMKLDIANHQLQTLRPFLIRNSGQFELKSFCRLANTNTPRDPPPDSSSSLLLTREWLTRSFSSLKPHQDLSLSPTRCISDLSRNQRIYIGALKGIVDLVFDPPPPNSYPETAYLDHSRLTLLTSDVLDLTAVGMFLMFYQGLCSSSSLSSSHQVTHAELANLKNEIRDITAGTAGISRVGLCLTCRCAPNQSKCGCLRQDITIQVARRAWERGHSSTSAYPDSQLVNLASRWATNNLVSHSPLTSLVKQKLADAVFAQVVKFAWHTRTTDPMSLLWKGETPVSSPPPSPHPSLEKESNVCAGFESLSCEIRGLAEKIARLGVVHLNAYQVLYEQDGFLHS